MYYIYILKSLDSGKYYVGHTDQPAKRLSMHNSIEHNTFTSKFRPWEMVALFECSDDRGMALKVEKFIKQQKSRTLIEKMILGAELTGILAPLVRVPHVRG